MALPALTTQANSTSQSATRPNRAFIASTRAAEAEQCVHQRVRGRRSGPVRRRMARDFSRVCPGSEAGTLSRRAGPMQLPGRRATAHRRTPRRLAVAWRGPSASVTWCRAGRADGPRPSGRRPRGARRCRVAACAHGGWGAAGAWRGGGGGLCCWRRAGWRGCWTGRPAWRCPSGRLWGPARLALDPLSAWFLLPVGLSAGCASLFALGGVHGPVAARLLVPWPLFLAGMALTILAADGFTLLLGFEAMSIASWALVAHDDAEAENRRAARHVSGLRGVRRDLPDPGLGPAGRRARGDVAFAALRDAPPEGWRAAAVLALVLAGRGVEGAASRRCMCGCRSRIRRRPAMSRR